MARRFHTQVGTNSASARTLSSFTTYNIAHGLGAVPDSFWAVLWASANTGLLGPGGGSGSSHHIPIVYFGTVNSTNLNVHKRVGSTGQMDSNSCMAQVSAVVDHSIIK